MKQIVSLKKQSKKAQKAFYDKQRVSWNGVCPISQIIPNGKAYDRNRIKQSDRTLGSSES